MHGINAPCFLPAVKSRGPCHSSPRFAKPFLPVPLPRSPSPFQNLWKFSGVGGTASAEGRDVRHRARLCAGCGTEPARARGLCPAWVTGTETVSPRTAQTRGLTTSRHFHLTVPEVTKVTWTRRLEVISTVKVPADLGSLGSCSTVFSLGPHGVAGAGISAVGRGTLMSPSPPPADTHVLTPSPWGLGFDVGSWGWGSDIDSFCP